MSTSRDATPATSGTLPRARTRPKATGWMKVGMILFAIGAIAILVALILFASGNRDLPLWLNLTCLLAPVGLGVGLVGTLVEVKASARRAKTDKPQ